jgi:hypothetical protein
VSFATRGIINPRKFEYAMTAENTQQNASFAVAKDQQTLFIVENALCYKRIVAKAALESSTTIKLEY